MGNHPVPIREKHGYSLVVANSHRRINKKAKRGFRRIVSNLGFVALNVHPVHEMVFRAASEGTIATQGRVAVKGTQEIRHALWSCADDDAQRSALEECCLY